MSLCGIGGDASGLGAAHILKLNEIDVRTFVTDLDLPSASDEASSGVTADAEAAKVCRKRYNCFTWCVRVVVV